MVTRTTGWIDLASPSHPFFFQALVSKMSDVNFRTTVRDKTETIDLASEVGFNYDVLGRDFDNPLLRKMGIILRTGQLAFSAPSADFSLSSRNAMCILASKARSTPSIHFTDNDITAYVDGLREEELYNRLEAMATHNVVPAAFEKTELIKRGADPGSIHTYDGYKEDVYIADFEPDPAFTEKFPFEEYIVIRPEALDAAYVNAEGSLVPDLLAGAKKQGLPVVYLPRGRGDEVYADDYDADQVYVPDTAINGLQLAWHARCMLTGSGTMAREAACMEKPAVSFFPNTLLSVDQKLADEGRIFHSRKPDEILDYVNSIDQQDTIPNRERSRGVRREVVNLVTDIVHEESRQQNKTEISLDRIFKS